MRSRFVLTVSVSVLMAGLGLTACSSSSTAIQSKPGGATAISAAPVTGPSTAAPSGSPATGAPTPTKSGSSEAAKCRTQNLKWTLTRLADAATNAKDPAQAELVVVNSGSHSCTLAGYPKLAFDVGKGPNAYGVGKGTPAPVTLGVGKQAVIALRYSEINGKGPDSGNCVGTGGDTAHLAAPGDSAEAQVAVVDQSGKPAAIIVCGTEVRMSPPAAR